MADRKQRVWARWLAFPSEREEYEPEPLPEVTGRDGKPRGGDYLRRSMGLPPAPSFDEDMGVTWTPWPPP